MTNQREAMNNDRANTAMGVMFLGLALSAVIIIIAIVVAIFITFPKF